MKTLKCSRCGCKREVEDNYKYKRCEKCRADDKTRRNKPKQKQDVLDLNFGLKPCWKFPTYKEWRQQNPEGKFKDYLEEKIEFEKERKQAREIHEETWEKPKESNKPKTLEEWEEEQGLK